MATSRDRQQRQQRGFRLWDLIGVGYRLYELANLPADAPLISTDTEHPGVIDSLLALLKDLESIDPEDSARQVRRIDKFKSRLQKGRENGDTELGTNRADELRRLLTEFRGDFEQELSRRYLYVPLPTNQVRGGVNRLIEDPSRAFELPDSADPALLQQVDPYLREAGRCLAVGFWPAAATCTLLAIESITRWYCERVVGYAPAATYPLKILVEHLASSGQPSDLVEGLQRIVQEHCDPYIYALLEQDDGTTAFDAWNDCLFVTKRMLEIVGPPEATAANPDKETIVSPIPGSGEVPGHEQRLRDIVDNISKEQSLLREFEQRLITAVDPQEKERLTQGIANIRQTIEQHQQEYDQLRHGSILPAGD